MLALTQHLIRRTPRLAVPRWNRAMIEEVYHLESRAALLASDERWDHLMNRHLRLTMGPRAVAKRWRLPLLIDAYSGEAMTELFRPSVDEELLLRSPFRQREDQACFDVSVQWTLRFGGSA